MKSQQVIDILPFRISNATKIADVNADALTAPSLHLKSAHCIGPNEQTLNEYHSIWSPAMAFHFTHKNAKFPVIHPRMRRRAQHNKSMIAIRWRGKNTRCTES